MIITTHDEILIEIKKTDYLLTACIVNFISCALAFCIIGETVSVPIKYFNLLIYYSFVSNLAFILALVLRGVR